MPAAARTCCAGVSGVASSAYGGSSTSCSCTAFVVPFSISCICCMCVEMSDAGTQTATLILDSCKQRKTQQAAQTAYVRRTAESCSITPHTTEQRWPLLQCLSCWQSHFCHPYGATPKLPSGEFVTQRTAVAQLQHGQLCYSICTAAAAAR